MTKREKRLERMARSPHNVSRRELVSLLESYGFVYRREKGSHSCYKHPALPEIKLIVPMKLKEAYVKQALEAIYRLRESEENG